jgi:hypothetical protein
MARKNNRVLYQLKVTLQEIRKRSVLAVWTGLILVGILPSGHSGGVQLEVRWTLRIPQ